MRTIPRAGTWSLPGQTQTAGTAIVIGIPPYQASGSGPLMYDCNQASFRPNWYGQPVTKVTYAGLTSGTTQHTWYFLRPKNWTYINEAVTANDTTIVMADAVGTYSTKYKYPMPPGEITAQVADNTPASGDYVAFQLDDGTWHFSLVSSLSSLTLTIATATPNITGGGAAVGRILFFFGAAADKDPATGRTDPAIIAPIPGSGELFTPFAHEEGLVTALHGGDPLLLYNANATAASTVASLAGVYGKY